MSEFVYDVVVRTFYLKNGDYVKWFQSNSDEDFSRLSWFDRWVIYAKSNNINLDDVLHEHKTEYFQWDNKTNKKVKVGDNMIETIMYKCEHCMKKVYKHKSSAKSHEKKCYWNIETESCMTCRRYMQTDVNDPVKVIGEETMCYFAEHNGFNYNCKGWRENIIE